MPPLTLAPPAPVDAELSDADRLAARNWEANLAALARTQPRLAEAVVGRASRAAWVFARDGSLTAFAPGPGERWHAGCSVPRLAAEALLETLDAGAGAACFLDPQHAAQVRVALDRLQASQALICVVPDDDAMPLMLHLDDYSDHLARGRLWFAWGAAWADELGRLLDEVEGLPAPTRFVRTSLSDASSLEKMVAAAQGVFSAAAARRAQKIARLRESWRPGRARPGGPPAVCVIARSTWRLWDDAGDALFAALAAADAAPHVAWRRFDPDDPAGSSPIALASAAASCRATVAADVSRADAPHLAHPDLPWVTWVTTPRVPPAGSAGPNDRLVLADPGWTAAALAAGWPAERVAVAGWPTGRGQTTDAPQRTSRPACITIVADTLALDVPAGLADFSSHGLLWEKLRALVLRKPFAMGDDVQRWLLDQARAEGIAPETIDVALFVTRLLVPAYQQALAAIIQDAGLPLRLHGTGWSELPRFAPHAAGPVRSREALRTLAATCGPLVHAWPGGGASGGGTHPIDALGRPVVRHAGGGVEGFLREARAALAGREPVGRPARVVPAPMSAGLLLSLLGTVAS